MMKIGECKVCLQVKELAESHIIPEFCYSTLYNPSHKMIGITGFGPKPSQKVQKGVRELLLCQDCENHRNRNIEQPYQLEWNRAAIASGNFFPGSIVNLSINFEVFRKFHLSILFLASVAKEGTWSEVSLGRHEDVLRRYIKGEITLQAWKYPIAGIITLRNDGTVEDRCVMPPSRSKLFGATFYGFEFCGVRWGYFVSSHANPELLKVCIKPSGNLSMQTELWTKFQSTQDLRVVLNGKSSS